MAEYRGVRWGSVCNLKDGTAGTGGIGPQDWLVHCLLILCYGSWSPGITGAQHRAEQPLVSDQRFKKVKASCSWHESSLHICSAS